VETVDQSAAEREPDHVTRDAVDALALTESRAYYAAPDPWTSRETLACSATGEHEPHEWTSAVSGSVHCPGLTPEQWSAARRDPAAVCREDCCNWRTIPWPDALNPHLVAPAAPELPDTDIRGALAEDLDRMGLMPEPERPRDISVDAARELAWGAYGMSAPTGDPATPSAEVIHFDAGRADQHAACGYDLDRNGPDGWTTDRAKVTCAECAGKLVDEQLVVPDVHLRIAIGDPIPCGSTTVRASTANLAEVTCAGCRPERRTVSVETLTDELRALAAREYTGGAAELLPLAKVAIVGRIDGRADAVTDIDSDWPYDGAASLAVVLHQAQGRALNAGAELLMPTPDVLAALSGSPDATFWTAPVPVTARHVEEGWLVVGYSGPGVEERVEAKSTDCGEVDCPWPGDCTLLTIGEDKPSHFADWTTLTVRIPCAAKR
jgi:hypothetical protein